MIQYYYQSDKVQNLLQVKDPSATRDEKATVDNSVLFPITMQLSFADPKPFLDLVLAQNHSHQQKNVVFDNAELNTARSGSSDYVMVVKLRAKIGNPDEWSYSDEEPLEIELPLVYSHVDRKTDTQGYGMRVIHSKDLNTDTGDACAIFPEQYAALQDADKEFFRVVRYTADNTPEGFPWIDVALRTIVSVRDPKMDDSNYTINQRRNYRIQYAEKGDPIVDFDDPYRPTMACWDSSMDFHPDAKADTINPPYRSSVLESIVNFSFSAAIELEKPGHPIGGLSKKPPITPSVNMATIVQDDSQVEDCTRFLFSGFFQFPSGQDLPSFSADWMLLEFGGNDSGISPWPGNPSNSSIRIAKGSDQSGDFFIWKIVASFVGGTKTLNYSLGTTYWGFNAADVDLSGVNPYGPHAGSSETAVFQRDFTGEITIPGTESDPGDETKMNAVFLDKWHHLAVTFDLNESDWNDAPFVIRYEWVVESSLPYDTHDAPSGGGSWNAPIRDAMNVFDVAHVDLNLGNTVPFAVQDIRGNPGSPGQPGKFDLSLLPDPTYHGSIFVLSQGEDGLSGYISSASGYIGTSLTSWPHVVLDDSVHHPLKMQMLLDRNIRMDTLQTGSDSQSYISFVLNDEDIESPDEKAGVVVKDRQISVPRKSQDKIPSEGSFTSRLNVDTRLAIYQVWFALSESPDLYLSTVKDRFTTTFVDTKDNKTYFKPASLTEEDMLLDPQNPPLSHAAARWGKPDLFMKGGKGSQDPTKPTGVMGSGFPKNRGKAGDFVKKETIINFSPPPRKMLLPP